MIHKGLWEVPGIGFNLLQQNWPFSSTFIECQALSIVYVRVVIWGCYGLSVTNVTAIWHFLLDIVQLNICLLNIETLNNLSIQWYYLNILKILKIHWVITLIYINIRWFHYNEVQCFKYIIFLVLSLFSRVDLSYLRQIERESNLNRTYETIRSIPVRFTLDFRSIW